MTAKRDKLALQWTPTKVSTGGKPPFDISLKAAAFGVRWQD